ncbi:MAG TPA: Kdo hydroxylase family protein [Terriglobia bacterium]|nr:Kdo hydroxylase family protein [Terriglobia bacterium]
MTDLLHLPNQIPADLATSEDRGRWCAAQLEEGNILFFPKCPLDIAQNDIDFLLGLQPSGAAYHKNIAYRPRQDRLTGARVDRYSRKRLRIVMREFSRRAERFASDLLCLYAPRWRVDFASFRPEQEEGRAIRLRARNDLLHVDAFPTRPVNGDRILRVFFNINPRQPRVWITSEPFPELAARFAGRPGLPLPEPPGPLEHSLRRLAASMGLNRLAHSPYDRWMLRLHHTLKEDAEFQRTCPRNRWEFPPLSAWIVFTDMVSHAVLSGQYALEQTFIVAKESLVAPDKAPVRVLESLAGGSLTLDH